MKSGVSIRVAREGDNVRSGNDYRLLFNSRWPVAPVVETGLIPSQTSSSTTSDIVIATHGLKYKPAFLLWQKQSEVSVSSHTSGPVSFPNNDGVDLASLISVDENRLYVKKSPSSVVTSDYDYYYAILKIDLGTRFESERINSNSDRKVFDTVSKKKTIFRIINDKPYPKNDTRRFSMHERRQPIIVHSVTPIIKTSSSLETIPVRHDLGYPPAFLVFGKQYGEAGGYRSVDFAPESSVGAAASVDGVNFNMSITLPFEGSVLLLKDPIL